MDVSMYRGETAQRLRAEGMAEAERHAVLFVLDQRGIELTGEERERVSACTDLDLLRTWLGRALAVSTGAELFTEE